MQTGISDILTVQITMLAPPRHPFDSPPGHLFSGLSGPRRLLQGHFLQTSPLALGNEGVPSGPQEAPNPPFSPPTFSPLPESPSHHLSLCVSSSKHSAGLNPPDYWATAWAHVLAGELTWIRGSGILI